MATRGGYGKQLDPDYEYPLAYRLAQFLLGSSDQLGQYTQGLGVQSKGASDVLESMERQETARGELARRTQEDLYTKEYRTADLAERRREADLKTQERAAATQQKDLERAASGTFFKHLAGTRPTQEPLAPIPEQATAISPQAEDRTLANFLWGQRQATPLEASQAMGEQARDLPTDLRTGILKEATEGDQFAAGEGGVIYSKRTGDIKRPARPKREGFSLGDERYEYDAEGVPRVVARNVKDAKAASLGVEVTGALREMGVDPTTATPEEITRARRQVQSERRELAENTGAVSVRGAAERATGPQPITAEERQRVAEGERSIQLAERSLTTMAAHPDWVGGPLGLRGRAREWQASLGTAPAGFAEFQSDVAELYGTYARRIAGAALTPTEKSTYLQYLPNLTTDSDQQFAAKLKAFPERVRVIDAALERARLGTGAPAAQAPAPGGGGKAQFRYNPTTRSLEAVP